MLLPFALDRVDVGVVVLIAVGFLDVGDVGDVGNDAMDTVSSPFESDLGVILSIKVRNEGMILMADDTYG